MISKGNILPAPIFWQLPDAELTRSMAKSPLNRRACPLCRRLIKFNTDERLLEERPEVVHQDQKATMLPDKANTLNRALERES